MKQNRGHIKRFILTVALLAGIVASLWVFVRDNTQRISRQNEEYIGELTLQRAVSVDSLIQENLSFIQTTATLYGKSLTSPWADVSVIKDFEENSGFDMLRFIDDKGDNYTSAGVQANLSDRAYYQAGMRGESGVTYVLQSRVTGQRQLGFYAPVDYEDEIIGVMVGFYGESFIQRLLEYELFGVQGEGWLCDRDGTALGSTVEDAQENFFDYLESDARCDAAELARIRRAFDAGEDISFTYKLEGEDTTGYAVALSQCDWMLVRNFPPSASLQIMTNANREGMVLIFVLVLLFGVYGLVLGVGVVVDQRRIKAENQNANYVSAGMAKLFERFLTVDMNYGEYRFITGYSPEERAPEQGDYAQYTRALLSRIEDEAQRREVAEFIDLQHLKKALADTDIVSVRARAPMGGAEWFTYNFIVIERREGAPTRMLIVRQDVTALRRREEEEQRKLERALDAAESASRAKTEFLFNMSHDIRTPMNAIIGYTELAEREGVSGEELVGYIRKIDASSQHLLALINDILEMSRIESGKLTLNPAPTDLTVVMDEAREMFAAQMRKKGIAFAVDTSGVRDRWALCDENRLNRVILNLISNAWKFTPEGGRIDVRLTQGEAPAGEGRYALSVKDSGIGMSPEFVERLFTPFERERTSTVSKIQGTGLGLSITKKIVDLMGGEIAVETEQGKGTEFIVTVTFPLAEEAAPAASAPEPRAVSDVDFSKARLLLAEDNEINREIATMLLTQAGFAVETAENGQAAVDALSAAGPGHFDAVLMDIQMPVMDGYAAARAIRAMEDPALAQIPIIAMTANAFQEDIETARAAGMNGHIAKPLNVEKMLGTLREVLAKGA